MGVHRLAMVYQRLCIAMVEGAWDQSRLCSPQPETGFTRVVNASALVEYDQTMVMIGGRVA